MNRRQFKKEILSLLHGAELKSIYHSLTKFPQHLVVNALFISLCHRQEAVRWNGVCCFGRIVSAMAEKDFEAARIVMRRFLWSLNDESGGIGWGAPEAMAEIMCHNSRLRAEYLHMLLSYMCKDGENIYQDGNYIELPMLQRGLLWGVGRLCQLHKNEIIDRKIVKNLTAYLYSTDPYVSGLALWCLSLLGLVPENDRVKELLKKDFEMRLFLNNTMQIVKVSQFI